jgi:hypothetical protein
MRIAHRTTVRSAVPVPPPLPRFAHRSRHAMIRGDRSTSHAASQAATITVPVWPIVASGACASISHGLVSASADSRGYPPREHIARDERSWHVRRVFLDAVCASDRVAGSHVASHVELVRAERIAGASPQRDESKGCGLFNLENSLSTSIDKCISMAHIFDQSTSIFRRIFISFDSDALRMVRELDVYCEYRMRCRSELRSSKWRCCLN